MTVFRVRVDAFRPQTDLLLRGRLDAGQWQE